MASKRGGTDLFSEPDPLVGNHRDSSLGLKQDAAPWESPNRNRVPNLRSLTRREAFRKTRPFSKPEYRRIMREDRSEERRVGKEWRARGARGRGKEKECDASIERDRRSVRAKDSTVA